MKKYSKVYTYEGYDFRYNYTNCTLENITKTDYNWESEEMEEIKLKDWRVVSEIGLSLDNWKDGAEYWVEQYYCDIQDEIKYEMRFL